MVGNAKAGGQEKKKINKVQMHQKILQLGAMDKLPQKQGSSR